MRHSLALSLMLAAASYSMIPTALAESVTPTMRAVLLSQSCAGCHGTDGNSKGPASPTIAGLSEDTFTEAMLGFQKGERPSTIMGRIAKGYSEDDIKLMAQFFAAQKFIPAKQDFNAELAAKGKDLHENYCAKCHEQSGKVDQDGSSILAGQWKPYLEFTLADFNAGDREAGKKMAKKLEEVRKDHGDDGIKALIEFYISQQ